MTVQMMAWILVCFFSLCGNVSMFDTLMFDTLLIWNPSSGNADRLPELRESSLGRPNVRWVEMSRDVDLVETIEHAIGHGCQTVVAAGGDGTINAIVNALMKTDANRRPAMAIVPIGTANDFAKTLAIPHTIAAVARLIETTSAIPIDVIRIEGMSMKRYFANIAAGGNCVRVSEAMTDDIKSTWGAFSYVRGAIDILPDMTTYRIRAVLDAESDPSKADRSRSECSQCVTELLNGFDSWAVLVANGRTNAGGIEVAPQASPADSWMDLIFIRDGNIRDMVDIVSQNLMGNFLQCDQVVFRRARSLTMQSDPPMRFTIDGEVVDEEPVRFVIEPGAIRMHVGREFSEKVEASLRVV